MIRLSIIVPFYNVERYIEQCIRSLYDQDIPQEEYEVICVDDCSPDGSRAIVERLQQEYPTLRLLCHTENKRQGGARNTGLKTAKGEYIWFVDSDDYVMPNIMGRLLEEAEKNKLDILQFDNNFVGGRNLHLYQETDVIDGIDYVCSTDPFLNKRIPLVWISLFRTAFLRNNSLQFVEHHQYEDTDFALRTYYFAKRVKYIPIPGYVYRSCFSTTSRPDDPLKMLDQVLLLNRTFEQYTKIDNVAYKEVLLNFVNNELSRVGICIARMSVRKRFCYYRLIRKENFSHLKTTTSFRNWLRLKYGLAL